MAVAAGYAGTVALPLLLTRRCSERGSLASAVTATLPGNADYTATTVTFAAGSTNGVTQDITVTAVNDTLIEGTETFVNQGLSSVTGPATVSGSGQAITITRNDTRLDSSHLGTTQADGGSEG